MGMKVTLALAAALLLGVAPDTAPRPAKTVPDRPTTPKSQKSTVTPEDATITISPGTKVSIHPVKTERGWRIRLKTPSVTIEAVRLRVKSEGRIYEMEIGRGDNPSIITHSYQDGVIGVSAEPASKAAQPRK